MVQSANAKLFAAPSSASPEEVRRWLRQHPALHRPLPPPTGVLVTTLSPLDALLKGGHIVLVPDQVEAGELMGEAAGQEERIGGHG